MRRRTPNVGQVITVLLTLTLFLVACGSTTTPSTPSNVAGNFVGPVPGLPNVDITLRTDGNTFCAYASDGDTQARPPRPPMINEWFASPVTSNHVDVMATPSESSPIPAHLVASWDMHAASGMLTFQGGGSFHFMVEEVGDPPIHPGLYRSELSKGGMFYLAGWVVLSSQEQRGGIINEQTGGLLTAPALTDQDIASGQVVEPDLGTTFLLTLLPLGEPVTPVVNFTATLNPSTVNCKPPPGQSKLVLDNTRSNVDVIWNIRFQENNPSQSGFWGSASSNSDTVSAVRQGEVVITPSSDLCQAGKTTTYHLEVSYTAAGLSQQSPIVLDYTVVV